jgi:competence protein ComEA
MKTLLLALVMWFGIYGVAMAAVNINTATKEELTSLKGIGEKRAQDIIDYRTKNGPFKSVDDLQKVPGIGPGAMKQIRPELTTTGKTVIDKPAATGTSKAGDTKAEKSETKKAESAKGDAMKTEKKAADTKTAKTTDIKKAEPAKGDAMKADPAKDKTAAKPKSDEKAKDVAKSDEKKTEKK